MAEKKTIGIGIIGFGNMGMAHAYSIENLKFFGGELSFTPKIIGVCTRSLEKSKTICDKFGFESAFASDDELIADVRIDVVDICTPNHMHLDTIKKARAAGKIVLCEKPLCPTYAEAKEAADDACGCGIVFNNRQSSRNHSESFLCNFSFCRCQVINFKGINRQTFQHFGILEIIYINLKIIWNLFHKFRTQRQRCTHSCAM